jgi:hypothetical protein
MSLSSSRANEPLKLARRVNLPVNPATRTGKTASAAARRAVFEHKHGAHTKPSGSVEILRAVFHQHAALRQYTKSRAHFREHGKRGFGPEGTGKAHLLDRHHLSHAMVQ